MPGLLEYLPTPDAILWFMAAFLVAWGLSVLPRAVTRTRGLRCPACAQPMKPEHGTRCPACLNDASTESNLHHRRRRPFRFAVGVLAIVAGVVSAMGAVHVGRFVRHGSLALSDGDAWRSAATGLLAFAVVLGAWACRGDPSRGRRRCPRCWYSMATTTGLCPECGYTSDTDRAWYRPRRRRRAGALVAILVALALALFSTPRVLRYGWAGAIPTTPLIAGMPWLPERVIDSRFNVSRNPGSLCHRVAADELWGWQARWLRRRAAGLVAGVPPVPTLLRAVPFLDPRDLQGVSASLLVHQAELLASPDPAVRAGAMDHRYFAWRMGTSDPLAALEPLRAGLLAALQDPRSDVRGVAAGALGRLPTLTLAESRGLLDALEDQPWVQRSAYESLGRHGRHGPDIVLATLIAYADPASIDEAPDTPHNRGVLLAIGLLADAAGPPPSSERARDALIALSSAPDARIARAARESLQRVDRRPTPPPIAPPPPR